MATTTKPNRAKAPPAAAPSAPPPTSVQVSAQGIPLRDYPGWDGARGGIVHGDAGKEALALVNAADPKHRAAHSRSQNGVR